MLFVSWSLIIRTCYQSKLFEYMQGDIRKAYHYNLTDILTNKTELRKFPGDNSLQSQSHALDATAEYTNKVYFVVPDFFINAIAAIRRSGTDSLHFHEDNVVIWAVMPTFFEFSPYFQEFNERIGRLLAGGFYRTGRLDIPTKPRTFEDIGAQVLTFEQLQLGFAACLIALALSIIVFIMEVAVHFVSTQIPWIYYVVKAYESRFVIGQERPNIEKVTEVTNMKSFQQTNDDKDVSESNFKSSSGDETEGSHVMVPQ